MVAALIFIFLARVVFNGSGGSEGSGHHVFAGGPVAQVDDAAAFAAERVIRILPYHLLPADRTFHKTRIGIWRASAGTICTKERGASVCGLASPPGSSVPTRS